MVWLYARLSKEDMDDEKLARAQLYFLKEKAQAMGKAIQKTFHADFGKSAFINDEKIKFSLEDETWTFVVKFDLSGRKDFYKILREAKNDKDWDKILIVPSWDRYCRDVALQDTSLRYLKALGARVIPARDTEEPFAVGIMGVKNRHESETMSKRIIDKWEYKFSEGLYVGSFKKFGYDFVKYKNTKYKTLKPNKDAEKVKKAFVRTIELGDNPSRYRIIGDELGITPQTYYRIIRDRTYLGEISWNGQTKKGIHIPLINEKTFEKANEVLG